LAYVNVPKDLNRIKTKVALNLTRRQLICFSAAGLVGVPLYLLTRQGLGNDMAALLMVLVMLPAFLLAMYERNGQHLETIVRNMLSVFFIRPRQRKYETNNFYIVLEKQHQLDKEVYRIVQKDKTQRKTK